MGSPQHVRVGQPMKAQWANDVVDALLEVGGTGSGALQANYSAGGTDLSDVRPSGFYLAELKDNIFQTNGTNKQAYRLQYNDSSAATPYYERAANNDYLDLVQDPFAFDSSEVGSLFLSGERHALMALPESGFLAPVPTTQLHIGKIYSVAGLKAGGSADVEVYKVDKPIGSPPTTSTTTYHVTAYDWNLPSGTVLGQNAQVFVFQHRQSQLWFVIGATPQGILCQYQGNGNSSGVGTTVWNAESAGFVVVLTGTPGSETNATGFTISGVWNHLGPIFPNAYLWVGSNGQNPYVVSINEKLALAKYTGSSTWKAGTNSSGTCEIYGHAPVETDLSFAVTAYNRFFTIKQNDYVILGYYYSQWYVIAVQPASSGIALDIDFHLSGTLAHGDTNATVTIDSYNNGKQPSGTVTVSNFFNFSLPNGGHGWATLYTYNDATGDATYRIRAVNMTEWSSYAAGTVQFLGHDSSGNMKWYDTAVQTVVTDWKDDTTAHEFQHKKRDLRIVPDAAETGFTTATGGTQDPCT